MRMLAFVKARTYSKDVNGLWMHEWRNSQRIQVPISDPQKFLNDLENIEGDQRP